MQLRAGHIRGMLLLVLLLLVSADAAFLTLLFGLLR